MSFYTYKFCVQSEDQEEIVDLFYSVREYLHVPDRETCQAVTELCFERGGVFGAYDGSLLVGAMGFFYGEPQCDHVNKEMVFMYVAGIRTEYHLSRVFLTGLRRVLLAFLAEGIQAIKLQAVANNPYTTRLYGRFAQPVARSRSLRGVETITYASSIEDALSRLPGGRRRQKVLSPSADGRSLSLAQ